MKFRQTLTSMFAALTVAAGFSIFMAPAANASPPPVPPASLGCTLVNDQAVYVRNGYYYYCGNIPATYRNPSASVWSTVGTALRTKLQNTSSYLIIFKTRADAETYYQTGVGGLNGKDGVTIKDTPDGTFTFNYQVSSTWETNSWDRVANILIHERGHALDNAYLGASQKTGAAGSGTTKSEFHKKVDLDWTYVNSLTRAQMFLRGVPNKKFDPVTGTWSTYNVGPAEGQPGAKTNKQILVDLFPWLFDGSSDANYELYAHLYQQYENGWNDDCPYSFVPQTGGATYNYLEWQEVFGKFRNVSGGNSGNYFRTMKLSNGSFVP